MGSLSPSENTTLTIKCLEIIREIKNDVIMKLELKNESD
jgi:hypothetical protein